MLSVDSAASTLLALDWDSHGELDQEDRQALLNLLTQDGSQQSVRPQGQPQPVHP